MNTTPEAFAASIAKQAKGASPEMLCALLTYATRAVISGSRAQEISEAETAAVLAEYKRRGIVLPFWARGMDKEAA